MKDFLIRKALEWLAANLTKEVVEEWADNAKQYILPKLHEYKDELMDKCRAEAAKSETKIDDMACDALDGFLDAFLPDVEKTL